MINDILALFDNIDVTTEPGPILGLFSRFPRIGRAGAGAFGLFIVDNGPGAGDGVGGFHHVWRGRVVARNRLGVRLHHQVGAGGARVAVQKPPVCRDADIFGFALFIDERIKIFAKAVDHITVTMRAVAIPICLIVGSRRPGLEIGGSRQQVVAVEHVVIGNAYRQRHRHQRFRPANQVVLRIAS